MLNHNPMAVLPACERSVQISTVCFTPTKSRTAVALLCDIIDQAATRPGRVGAVSARLRPPVETGAYSRL